MSIRARIATGLFLLAGLTAGVLAYELSVVDRLQGITSELSRTSVEAARVSIVVLQGLEGVREFAAKATALRDEEYRRQWQDWERSVEEALARLASVGLTGAEEEAIRARIRTGWQEYLAVGASLWEDPSRLPRVETILETVKARVQELIDLNGRIVAEQASISSEAGARARTVAWVAAGSALLVAIFASTLLFMSISGPLRRLTGGTRELSQGRFGHRLEVTGPSELAQLAAAFNLMAARLAELEDMKKDFVSHVSHELKTPLAAVRETIEVLLERLAGPLTDKQAHLLGLSRTSAERLSMMIGELLEVSRLEAGAATYEPRITDVHAIVKSVLDEMQPLAVEEGIALAFDPGEGGRQVVCDGVRIREVVGNLVGNALKFSPRGKSVRVGLAERERVPEGAPGHQAAALGQETGPFVVLTVDDEGTGVLDEDKERIFEKFHQTRRSAPIRGQGVGLGLAIARHITQAHGGAVWVEDRRGGGARFRVVLPVRPHRWRHVVDAEEPEVPGPTDGPTDGARPGAPALAPGTVAALLVLFVGGCASSNRTEAMSTSIGAASASEAVAVVETVEADRDESMETRLARGFAALGASEYEAADREFLLVLAGEPSADERAQGLWGRAIVHLTPGSYRFDPVTGRSFLDLLVQDFPDTLHGVQARWMRDTLAELGDVRRQAEERQVLLDRLNEALEAIRQIDLDRRPSPTQPRGG